MDVQSIAEKVIPAVLAGAGSAGVTLWKVGSKLLDKIKKLEAGIPLLQQAVTGDAAAISALRGELAALFAEVREDISRLQIQMRTRASRREAAEIQVRLSALEARLDQLEEGLGAVASSLKSYITEQQDQWNNVHRTMGQLEGYIRARAKVSESAQFPASPK